MLTAPYSIDGGERLRADRPGRSARASPRPSSGPAGRCASGTRETSRAHGAIFVGGLQNESWLGVPILAGDQVIGVIALESLEQDAYDEADDRLLSTLAASMGVALENARLFDETQPPAGRDRPARGRAGRSSTSVQEGLAAELDMQAMNDLVGEKIARDLRRQARSSSASYDAATGVIGFPYGIEEGHARRCPTPIELGRGLTSKVIESKRALRLGRQGATGGARRDHIWRRSASHGSASRSSLAIGSSASSPSRACDRHAFDEADERLLGTLAASMGVALENARLFDETKRLLTETDQRAAELAIITSVQDGLAAKLDMQAMYDLVGDKIREIFDAQVVDIGIYDPQADVMHFPYTIERGVRFPDEPISLRDCRCADRIGIDRDPTARAGDAPAAAREHPRGVRRRSVRRRPRPASRPVRTLWAPLVVGDESRGVISLQNLDRENAFSESDVRLLTHARGEPERRARERPAVRRDAAAARRDRTSGPPSWRSSTTSSRASPQQLDDPGDVRPRRRQDPGDLRRPGRRHLDLRRASRAHPLPVHDRARRATSRTRRSRSSASARTSSRPREPLIVRATADAAGRPSTATRRRSRRAAEVAALRAAQSSATRSTGVISLQNLDREDAFGESDVRLLTTLAASLSVALENVRLIDETRQRVAELATVNEVGTALADQLDLSTPDRARRRACPGRLRGRHRLRRAARPGRPSRSTSPTTGSEGAGPSRPMALGEGLTSRIIATGEPLLLNRDAALRRDRNAGRRRRPRSRTSACRSSRRHGHRRDQRPEHRRGAASARPTPGSCRRSPPTSAWRSRTPGSTRRRTAAPTRWPPWPRSARRSRRRSSSTGVLQRIGERAKTLLDADTSAAFLREPARTSSGRSSPSARSPRRSSPTRSSPGEGIIGDLVRPGCARVRQRRRPGSAHGPHPGHGRTSPTSG